MRFEMESESLAAEVLESKKVNHSQAVAHSSM